jgi:RNA polymerase sigma-70 factor, ECF subfamily
MPKGYCWHVSRALLLFGKRYPAPTSHFAGSPVVFQPVFVARTGERKAGLNLAFFAGRVERDRKKSSGHFLIDAVRGPSMSAVDSFPQLLARVREGDDEAAAVIFQRFVDQLVAQAYNHLSPAVRRGTDAEDVVQSVYRTFFRRAREGEFRLDHWGSLWGLLTRITVLKCARVSRDESRALELFLAPATDASASSTGSIWQALAREPSPAEAAALNDTIDALLRPLRESHREIVRRTLQGYTQEEIAAQLDCSERSVRRVLAQAQFDLEKLDPTYGREADSLSLHGESNV